MDLMILAMLGFSLACYCGIKAHEAAVNLITSKLFGTLAFTIAFISVMVGTSVVSEWIIRRECQRSHDPEACIADQWDTSPSDVD